MAAAALVNCCDNEQLKLCGTGFLDTTRIASGDVGLWHDIIVSNGDNIVEAVDLIQNELSRLKAAVESNDGAKLCRLLEQARKRRQWLVDYKLRARQID